MASQKTITSIIQFVIKEEFAKFHRKALIEDENTKGGFKTPGWMKDLDSEINSEDEWRKAHEAFKQIDPEGFKDFDFDAFLSGQRKKRFNDPDYNQDYDRIESDFYDDYDDTYPDSMRDEDKEREAEENSALYNMGIEPLNNQYGTGSRVYENKKKIVQITTGQLQQIIKEGVARLHKQTLIENRIKQINEELRGMGIIEEKEINQENKEVLSENFIDLRASVLGLAKNNNGIFKSEKQASFLKSIIDKYEGLVGHTEHGRPYFAYYDDKGITKIEVGNPAELYWERKEIGILRPADIKHIKQLQRQIKQLEKELASREEELKNGTYTDPYGVIPQKKEEIARKNERINQIQNS